MSIPITDIYIWMLVLCRCCGLLAGVPFGGENNGVPNTVKILMACAISYITLTVVKLDVVVPNAIYMHFLMVAREVCIGLAMGFIIKISFAMVEMAGYLLTNEIGLNSGEMFNPLTESSSSTSGVLLTQFAIVIFFVTGLDKELLRCFLQSYVIMDFSQGFKINNLILFVDWVKNIFVFSLKIAAPLMVLNFLINFGFAILGKAAPKANVFFLSFPLRIFSGLCLLSLMIYLIYTHIDIDFRQIPHKIFTLLGT